MERLTSKKNATAASTGRTVGSWYSVYRCGMRKDASYGGTGRTPILKIESRPKVSCDASPADFSVCKTRSDAESPGTYTTPRGKASLYWQRCLVNSGVQFLRASGNHVGFFPSVRRWRTGAFVKSAHFLICCTRRCWIRLGWEAQFVTM